MSYTHINSSNRNGLSALIRAGTKQKDTATLLGKHRTTIYREIRRNSDNRYHARVAKERVYERKKNAEASRRKMENNVWLQLQIERLLKKKYSPEQIAGRLHYLYENNPSRYVGKDTIYQYIYTERKDLVKYLRCKKGNYRRRYGNRIREKRREKLKKRRIDTRPAIVERCGRIGDWEGDTIVGSDKLHIPTHVDRKSGLLLADMLGRDIANVTTEKTIARFMKLPKKKRLTCTYDNGSTFADHKITVKRDRYDYILCLSLPFMGKGYQ